MREKIPWRLVGYIGFGAFALLVSLYLTFPAQAVAQRVAQELARKSGGRVSVRFGDVSPYRLSGLAADAVVLHVERPGAQPIEVTFNYARGRVRLLPLLIGRLSFDVGVENGEGSLDARITPGKEETELALEADQLDLASPPLLAQLVGLPVRGVIDGKVKATLAANTPKSEGSASLTVSDVRFGPGTVSGFSVPGIALGQLDLALDLRDGRMRIASFKQQGGDIELKLEGSSHLRPQLAQSSLDACVQVKAADKAPSNLRAAAQLAEVRLRKDPQGFLHAPLAGTLAGPRLRGGLCRQSPRR